MSDLEVTEKSSVGINESIEAPVQDSTIIWVVASMLVVWACVIIMSLF